MKKCFYLSKLVDKDQWGLLYLVSFTIQRNLHANMCRTRLSAIRRSHSFLVDCLVWHIHFPCLVVHLRLHPWHESSSRLMTRKFHLILSSYVTIVVILYIKYESCIVWVHRYHLLKIWQHWQIYIKWMKSSFIYLHLSLLKFSTPFTLTFT